MEVTKSERERFQICFGFEDTLLVLVVQSDRVITGNAGIRQLPTAAQQ